MYNAQYFINKFSAIPEDQWTTNICHDDDKSCALGHCGARYTSDDRSVEANALRSLFVKSLHCCVHQINDNMHYLYTQDTPKQRILAALKHIKAEQGQVEISDPPVYVEDFIGEEVIA